MNKDQIIAELFFSFRTAKRLLQIDHPTCGCGKPSIGCIETLGTGMKRVVDGRCEDHWPTTDHPTSWRVRWGYLESAEDIRAEEDETPAE